ncbi:class I SAM-dependent methyltransferase [Paludibacterium sp. THUN1379]|uniref:class I SAM-dependent methyltransferase n=1 Tax=Paludibacterium sp. THUN1379 TaxID=3112107 RepID=UPI003087B191|nr:class I SAM-dependent methyltransferase [Paludibacterium sp. THUN1379]
MSTLPEPSPAALAISQQLQARLRQIIADAGGWIPFSHYMEQVLYAPGLGYYAAGSHKLGGAGDFTTAPEMTSLFGATLARQLAELLPQTAGTLYEFGAGSGRLAVDLLRELEQLDSLPAQYCILDLSPDLIARQRDTLRRELPHLLPRVQWLTALPDTLDGVIIGNEVLDAMPCELIHWTPAPMQRGVVIEGEQFAWQDRPIDHPDLQARADALAIDLPGYTSEISLSNLAFLRTLASQLTRGAILLLDYGFPQHEYYHPQRRMGTLIGHYRHHTIDDPFYLPGLMDLTCHVDFSAVAQAGIDAGLDLIGYTSQAQFLINSGIGDVMQRLDPQNVREWAPQAAAVQKLMSPAEMGELFKVIGFGRAVSIDWTGFVDGDRCHTL